MRSPPPSVHTDWRAGVCSCSIVSKANTNGIAFQYGKYTDFTVTDNLIGGWGYAVAIGAQDRVPAKLTGWLFFAGIVVFSGSLYALALTGTRWFGAITPLGGIAFLAGWAILAVKALKQA